MPGLARGRGAPKALLVVSGAAFPLAVAIHTAGAKGAGEQVGGARGHEVTDCRGNVHSLVCHWKLFSGTSTPDPVEEAVPCTQSGLAAPGDLTGAVTPSLQAQVPSSEITALNPQSQPGRSKGLLNLSVTSKRFSCFCNFLSGSQLLPITNEGLGFHI